MTQRAMEITGKQFGWWLVESRAPDRYYGKTKYARSRWNCRCLLCGEMHDVEGSALVLGTTRSCQRCGRQRAAATRRTKIDGLGTDRVSTSFNRREIETGFQLMSKLLLGHDLRLMAKNKHVARLLEKFSKLRTKLDQKGVAERKKGRAA